MLRALIKKWVRGGGTCGAIILTIIAPFSIGRAQTSGEQSAESTIQAGSINGKLDNDSEIFDDSTYFQKISLEGKTGQQITIELTSDEFNPYLILMNPQGEVILEDDDGGNLYDARIVTTLAQNGTYQIFVNSSEPKETGNYTLSWRGSTLEDLALERAQKLIDLAEELLHLGKYAEVMSVGDRALAMQEKILGADHPEMALSLYYLGSIYSEMGHYSEALPLLQRALPIRRKVWGEEHPELANIFEALGSAYFRLGNYAKALSLHQNALSVREKVLGNENYQVGASLLNIGLVYHAQENYTEALSLYQRALAILEKALGAEHSYLATGLTNIASLYLSQGNYAKASPLYQRALSINEKVWGKQHPDVASSLTGLATLYLLQKNYGKALPLYQRAQAIWEEALGEQHPKVAHSFIGLAYLHLAQNDISRSLKYFTRSTDIEERNLALNLTTGTETQKRAYFSTFSKSTDRAISLHLQHAPDNLQAASLALTTILRRKGRVLDSVADTYSLLRKRLEGEDAKLLDELAATNSQLQALEIRGLGDTSSEDYRQQLTKLRNQAETLEVNLFQRSTAFRHETQLVTFEAVQQQIPTDAALIEFIRYRPFNHQATQLDEAWGTARYAAYVLSSQGKPQWRDLGEADTIDQLVNNLRRQLTQPPAGTTGLASRATRQAKESARQLDERLMQPVRQLLGNTRTLLLAPDSQLNLIPFGALVDENNNYLVENYSVTYLTSGRDLLKLDSTTSPQQEPVMVANPDYGTETDSQQIANQGEETEASSDRRSADLRSFDGCCSPLAGTQQEAEAIAPLFPKVNLLTQAQATEAAVKDVNAPKILHIASHGFFLPAQVEPLPTSVGSNSLSEMPIVSGENPLLRSGLALAGFNPSQGKLDGALTALEVTNLNLWGTKLVVLSACSTGVGEVVDGEGVYGLRRALVIAGAESQLISLWNVSDFGTKDLMTSYYQKLLAGAGRTEALRQTQLELLNGEQYSHPFYWAAFIPSGNWTAIDGDELTGKQ